MPSFDLQGRQAVEARRHPVFPNPADVVHGMVERQAGVLAVCAAQGQNVQIWVVGAGWPNDVLLLIPVPADGAVLEQEPAVPANGGLLALAEQQCRLGPGLRVVDR
jgi:hypothetical protein